MPTIRVPFFVGFPFWYTCSKGKGGGASLPMGRAGWRCYPAPSDTGETDASFLASGSAYRRVPILTPCPTSSAFLPVHSPGSLLRRGPWVRVPGGSPLISSVMPLSSPPRSLRGRFIYLTAESMCGLELCFLPALFCAEKPSVCKKTYRRTTSHQHLSLRQPLR